MSAKRYRSAGAVPRAAALSVAVLAAFVLLSCGDIVDSGSGGWSGPPDAPEGVSAEAESSSAIEISWFPVSGASGYHVYYSQRVYGPFSYGTTVYSAQARHPGLSANTSYYYRVSAFNSAGEGPQSATVQARTFWPNQGGTNPFIGTWNGYQHDGERVRALIGTSTWTVSWPDHPLWVLAEYGTNSGTYTYSGNTAVFRIDGGTIGTGTVSGTTMSLYLSGYGPLTLSRY